MRRDQEDPTQNAEFLTTAGSEGGKAKTGQGKVLDIREHASAAEPKKFFATVRGKEYQFQEMSLAQKLNVL